MEWRLIDGYDGYWLHVPCGARCLSKGQQHSCVATPTIEKETDRDL